jgi:tetratricopeptide (TPR) repeat protein
MPKHVRHVADESVRHLIELGYSDPDDAAAEKAERRRRLQAELDRALQMNAQGQRPQAVALLENVARDDPDWPTPRQRLAEIYYNAGDWQRAQAQLDWLAYHGVEHPRLALIAGAIALTRRDMRTALEELQYVRHVEPNLTSVHTLLGNALLRLQRWDEAEDAFRQAVQQDPNDARARDGLAAICLQHGEYEDAADWALRALEQDMRLFRAHYHLGLALVNLNRPAESIQALETSAKIDAMRTAPYYRMAQIARDQFNDSVAANRYRELARKVIRQRRSQRASAVATLA